MLYTVESLSFSTCDNTIKFEIVLLQFANTTPQTAEMVVDLMINRLTLANLDSFRHDADTYASNNDMDSIQKECVQ